jgi:hypothetical protein
LKNQVIFPATELVIVQKFEEPGHLSLQKLPAVFQLSHTLFLPGSGLRNPAPGCCHCKTTTCTLKVVSSTNLKTVELVAI